MFFSSTSRESGCYGTLAVLSLVWRGWLRHAILIQVIKVNVNREVFISKGSREV